MKAIGLKIKIFVGIALIFLMIFVGTLISHLSMRDTIKNIDYLGDKAMTSSIIVLQADMAHDQLRAIAFRGVMAFNYEDSKEIEESQKEFSEAKEIFTESLKKLKALNLSKQVADEINIIEPKLMEYTETIALILDSASKGNAKKLQVELPILKNRFESLADELAKLEADITKEAEASRDKTTKNANLTLGLIWGILGLLSLGLVGVGIWGNLSIIHPITETTEHLKRTSDFVKSSSESLSQGSTELASGVSRQAAALEETSATLEEITSVSTAGNANTKNLKNLTNEARLSADSGALQMASLKSAMTEINQAGREIANIIKTIDDIAFQTNLLALNASIEAARAGEHGKGFAVVAEEVRNLSQRTVKAAKETSDKIQDSISKSLKGVQATEKVNEYFIDIVKKVHNVDEILAEFKVATEEQSKGIQQINQSVSEIGTVVQDTTSEADSISEAANKLNQLAEELEIVVQELEGIVGKAVVADV